MTNEFKDGAGSEEFICQAKSVFEKVRDIPYVLGLDGNPNKLITEYRGNCTRKHLYLATKLIPLGYKISLGVAVFNWRELPIPEWITSLLNDPTDTHLFLYVGRNGKESVVDATWDNSMPDGFIKNTWDGENSTQIGVPTVNLRRQDMRIFQTKLLVGQPLRVIKNSLQSPKPTPFNDAFNQWLGRSK